MFKPGSDPYAVPQYVMQSTKDQAPTRVKVYNLAQRRIMDREITDKPKSS
jgi:hypothetical protein